MSNTVTSRMEKKGRKKETPHTGPCQLTPAWRDQLAVICLGGEIPGLWYLGTNCLDPTGPIYAQDRDHNSSSHQTNENRAINLKCKIVAYPVGHKFVKIKSLIIMKSIECSLIRYSRCVRLYRPIVSLIVSVSYHHSVF